MVVANDVRDMVSGCWKEEKRKKERKENGDFFSNYKNIIFKNKLYFPYFFSRKKWNNTSLLNNLKDFIFFFIKMHGNTRILNYPKLT